MIEAIVALLIPAATTAVVGFVRERIAPIVRDKFVPAALALGGGILSGLGALAGLEIPVVDLIQGPVSAWVASIGGVLTGLASVGIHQVLKQLGRRE